MRVRFKKGGQRAFLDLVIERVRAPSLRGLLQFGLGIPYSSLKNYYSEARLLPEDLFDDLCFLAKVEKESLGVEFLGENWGRVKGGKKKKK